MDNSHVYLRKAILVANMAKSEMKVTDKQKRVFWSFANYMLLGEGQLLAQANLKQYISLLQKAWA